MFLIFLFSQILPPCVVYESAKEMCDLNVAANWPTNWTTAGTKTGCTCSGLWQDYVQWLEEYTRPSRYVLHSTEIGVRALPRSTPFPLTFREHEWRILLYDGCSVHLSMIAEQLEYLKSHRVVAMRLPPNTTHVTQPCDQFMFGRLELELQKTRRDWDRTLSSTRRPCTSCSYLCTGGCSSLRPTARERTLTIAQVASLPPPSA